MPVYVSDLFTATPAPVNATPASTRTWQWLRGSSAISGATSDTYTAVTADIGSTLSATQLETNFLATTTATSAATEVVQAFDPIRLFSASEPGVWYDPTDMSTLFQNATGTIPVTSFGQPVGLMLDKSRGLVLGSEKITNGDFSSGTTGWSGWNTNAQISVSGGQMTVTQPVGGNQVGVGNTTAFATVVGRTYAVSLDLVSFVGATQIRIGDFNGSNNAGTFLFSESAGRKTGYFVANSTIAHVNVATASAAGSTITFDNISVKELPGLHATQSTDASRPFYGIVPVSGRRNLLTQTEDYSNVAYFGAGVTFSGQTATFGTTGYRYGGYNLGGSIAGKTFTASVTLSSATKATIGLRMSGAVTGSDDARLVVNLTPTPTRYTLTRTFTSTDPAIQVGLDNRVGVGGDGIAGDVVVTQWQLESGSTSTAYQKVTTDLDVTEAGVASVGYLRFDGSTSWMVTPTITPGTDKVQVFAGVRKLSDVIATIAEMSVSADANNGIFALANLNPSKYFWRSKGTTASDAFPASAAYAPPITNVITGLGDIAGDLATLRVNGTQAAQATTDQGTGDFLAYPLYIGRRGGTSLPLNGHLFPLIVRFGPNLTAARIAATEAWVATKTAGVTL